VSRRKLHNLIIPWAWRNSRGLVRAGQCRLASSYRLRPAPVWFIWHARSDEMRRASYSIKAGIVVTSRRRYGRLYDKPKLNSVAWVRERTSPTERPPLGGEVSANFWEYRVSRGQHNGSPLRILGFLDRSRYFFFQVAPQLYSRGWVDPVPDPLRLRKSGSAGNRTRTSGSVARNSN
jgi:hypothetical protein